MKMFVVLLVGGTMSWPTIAFAKPQQDLADKAEFVKLCDLACEELSKEITPFRESYRKTPDPKTHHVPFFEDSYAVRALAVAYDVTGKRQYLNACQHWSDRVIDLQEKMIPQGAYYLNYGREPGETSGDWFVADSGSVAMGILATAARTTDKTQRQRYLNSVTSFSRLVIDNYLKDGGITDGIWSGYAGPWFCSTSTCGAALFLLYGETGQEEYLKVALGALDWMLGQDFRKVGPIGFPDSAPHVVFYSFEFYAVGLKHLQSGSARRKAAAAQIAEAMKWLAENQQGRGAKSRWNYLEESTYMSGMPYLMYIFARQLPEHRGLEQAADQELRYVHGLLWKNGAPPGVSRLTTWELMAWAMMSYAEKLNPG